MSRWHEEIILVLEEMRRTVAFLQWKAQWWRDLAAARPAVPTNIDRRLIAYSRRQETQLLRLAEQFANLWRPTLHEGEFDVSWVDTFLRSRQQS